MCFPPNLSSNNIIGLILVSSVGLSMELIASSFILGEFVLQMVFCATLTST